MKKVLIIDSDPLFARTIARILETENFSALIATDGKDATGKLSAHRFDLVITDAFMPYVNGPEMIHKVRNQSVDVPIMVVSDVSHEQSIAGWLHAGADAHLQKPLNIPQFLTGIRQLMIYQNHVAA